MDPCIDPRCEHKEQLSAWKQKCAQAEQKAAKLQRTLVELGKANQKLQEGLKAQESSKANSQRKRKRQDSLDEPFARNGRRKIGGLSEQIAEAGSGSLGFLDVSSSSPEGLSTLSRTSRKLTAYSREVSWEPLHLPKRPRPAEPRLGRTHFIVDLFECRLFFHHGGPPQKGVQW